MPIRDNIQNINAFICERVLYEHDGVLSAIRFIDIFFVPEDRPADFKVPFTFVVLVKFTVGYTPPANLTMRLTLVRSTNEREVMGEQPLRAPDGKTPGAPLGFGLISQIQLIPRNMGTAYLEAALGDEVIATVPFTLSQQPPPPLAQPQ